MSENVWSTTDAFLTRLLVPRDPYASFNEAAEAAGLRPVEVPPVQGKFLALLCRMVQAKRVLEVGTLAGYSTAWLASAVGLGGRVTTCEINPDAVKLARANLDRAKLGDRVEILPGPAEDSLDRLIAAKVQPYDLFFIDADRANNVTYLLAALRLSHPGTVIVVDNVIRAGRVTSDQGIDADATGSRAALEMIASHPRLDGTAMQTVDFKGHDGFAIALVR